MIRPKIERRKDAPKLTWLEFKVTLSIAFLFASALVFLFLSILLATKDGVLIISDSGPYEIAIAVVTAGFVALAIDRLVAEFRGKR